VLNDAAHDTTHGSPYINTMFEIKEHVNKHGGNAWYGSDFENLFGQAATCADEIMTGAKTPAQIPNYTSTLSGGGAAHASRKKSKKKSTKKKSAKKSAKKQSANKKSVKKKSVKKKSVKKRSGKKKSTRKKK